MATSLGHAHCWPRCCCYCSSHCLSVLPSLARYCLTGCCRCEECRHHAPGGGGARLSGIHLRPRRQVRAVPGLMIQRLLLSAFPFWLPAPYSVSACPACPPPACPTSRACPLPCLPRLQQVGVPARLNGPPRALGHPVHGHRQRGTACTACTAWYRLFCWCQCFCLILLVRRLPAAR
jgi:hypothetical protein